MIKVFYKYCFVATIAALMSCSKISNQPEIKFSNDHKSIIINNIDKVDLLQVKNAVAINPDSTSFLAVLLSPTEEDSLQKEELVEGKVVVQGDSVVFLPKSPFVKGKTYLVENYINIQFANTEKLLKGAVNGRLSPQVQILKL